MDIINKINITTQNDKKLLEALDALPANYWDFKADDVREYTHGIHNYPAMMVCPISRNILRIVQEIRPVNTLLDPFMGSGTVVVEGMLANIPQVYGTDINPLALFLSKVKTTRLASANLQSESQRLLERIYQSCEKNRTQINGVDNILHDRYELDLTAKKGWGENAPVYLKKYQEQNNMEIEIPNFKNLGYWFKPRVILLLSLIKSQIQKTEDKDIRDFFFIAFSETIRFVSNRRNGEFKMFRMPAVKVKTFEPDVIREFISILNRNIEKMNAFTERCGQIDCTTKVSIFRNNATILKDIPDGCVDLVITSPPYGDSRTTVAYGEYSRLSLQWLDLDLSEKEIMGIDKSLMGGNKFKNGFKMTIPSRTLQQSLQRLQSVDLERAGDVYSFYLDLEKAISTISRKTRIDGYHFWVVGNRTVKGETLLTDRVIAEVGQRYGMDYLSTIDRNIVNKVMPMQNSPTNQSGKKSATMTNEHIVVLKKRKC